jgi:iron complex outermembrane recepter protein
MKKFLRTPFKNVKVNFCLLFWLICSINLFAQQVSGTIQDKEGSPIVGASVLVKGTANGTVTDGNGAFSLNNVAKGSTLVVSFVGYKTQEINADGGNMTIAMTEGDALDEVVVTGVFDKRSALNSSIAITTLNAA